MTLSAGLAFHAMFYGLVFCIDYPLQISFKVRNYLSWIILPTELVGESSNDLYELSYLFYLAFTLFLHLRSLCTRIFLRARVKSLRARDLINVQTAHGPPYSILSRALDRETTPYALPIQRQYTAGNDHKQ